MIELHNAREVARILTRGDRYVYWAPGDATLYRVTLLRAVAYAGDGALDATHDMVALLVLVGDQGHNPHLLIQRPRADYDRWTAETFHRAFGPQFAGWWAGVRPLLAALEWTPEDRRDVRYRPESASEIAGAG